MTHALFSRPGSVAQALELLADGGAIPLAGGTDYYAARVGQPPSGRLVDLTGIGSLRVIERLQEGGWRIGGAVTWRDLLRADLPAAFDGLKLAAQEVGGIQVQNCGTIAGNLCNASPAADGVPPLLALDAQVELSCADGTRTIALSSFITGPRRTAKRPGELLTAVLVPASAASRRSHFAKLGARRYLLISIVMVAASVEVDGNGRLRQVAVAVGSCSPVARRLAALEQRLVGTAAVDLAQLRFQDGDFKDLSPIDDVRATGAFRLDAAATLVRRVLSESVAS